MIKRRLISGALLLGLAALVFTYVLIMSNLQERVYTLGQQEALVIHRRMNLTQSAPQWNLYVGEELVDPNGDPGLPATMGATDCRVRATLDARYEEVEGLSTTVYDLDFAGTYQVQNGGPATTTLELIFPFPEGLDTLNQVYFLVDGQEPRGVQYSLSGITWRTELVSGEAHEIEVRYRARGVGSFRYALDHDRRLENLDVEVAVKGPEGAHVPDDFLPPTAVDDVEGGERFAWRYDALIAERDVQVTLPTRPTFAQRVERLQAPLRALSLSSPFLVALFVVCLVVFHRLSGVRLQFLHYLLAGLGFFLFYPTLTFLCGVLELPLAAAAALTVVTLLLVAFVGRMAGWRRTWWQTALLCVVFLGLFSLGGMTALRGLLITCGALILVGATMLLVVGHRAAEPEPPEPEGDVLADPQPPQPPQPEPAPARHCTECGAPLAEGFAFCPSCGHDATAFRRCPACGAQHYAPAEADLAYCPACGERMGVQRVGERT